MEIDYLLHKIQGVLKNEQRIESLSTIKKDNATCISRVVDGLTKVVGEEEFNRTTKQKLYILLFLNTDLEVCNDLKKNKKYAHLVGFFPKLSKDLFMKIVVGLKLDQYLYESVQYFPSCLSYKALEMTIKSLSWIDPFESVTFVDNVLVSLFNKIAVLVEEDNYNTPLKLYFQELLLHYNAGQEGIIKRIGQWKKSKLKHYAGLVMASMLSLLEKCSKIYLKKWSTANPDDFALYSLNIDDENRTVYSIKDKNITTRTCYEYLVGRCYENVCSITIDLWMFWVEIDLDDIPDTENTLQRLIGENAYKCREILQEIHCVDVSSKEVLELILRLKNVAIKPKTEEDVACSLDLAQVINNVQDPSKNSRKWLKYLVNKSEFVVKPESLGILKNRVNSLSVPDFLVLLKILFEYTKSTSDNRVQKDFILEIAKCLDFDYQTQLLQCFIENFALSKILKRDDFQAVFIETFNKVINIDDKENEIYSQFLSLALQDAEEVVCKAVTEGVSSEIRGHLMADILGRLQPFCDAHPGLNPNPLLVVALERLLFALPNLPENHRSNYSLFVKELVMRKSLDGEKFIKVCLMSEMHNHLNSKNFTLISVCLETFSDLNDIHCEYDHLTCLVMLMQVVEAIRWTPTTFSMTNTQVCVLGLDVIDRLIKKLLADDIEEGQRRKLSAVVGNFISPLNRYHLSRVLTDEQIPSDPALQLVYRMHYGIGEWTIEQVIEQERTKLVYSLCYVLPLLTSTEWQELFCVVAPKCSEFMHLFHIVTDSLLLCLDSTKINPDSVVLDCLTYAILNVADVIKYEVSRWNCNDNEYRVSVLRKMCQLMSELPLGLQEAMGFTLVKVLQQLLPEGSRRRPLTDEEYAIVTASIALIQESSVRNALAMEFYKMM